MAYLDQWGRATNVASPNQYYNRNATTAAAVAVTRCHDWTLYARLVFDDGTRLLEHHGYFASADPAAVIAEFEQAHPGATVLNYVYQGRVWPELYLTTNLCSLTVKG